MIDQIFKWYTALPLVAVGWFGKKILGPSADALGDKISDWLSSFTNRTIIAKDAYLKLETLVKNNHNINGHRVFYERKTFLHDKQIMSFISSYGSVMRRAIKNAWIDESVINSYNGSDIFFAGMELFLNELGGKDMKKIYDKYKENDQAALWPFLELVEERKPKILFAQAVDYLQQKQKEWKQEHGGKT